MKNSNLNLVIAMILATFTIIGWHFIVERPNILRKNQAFQAHNDIKDKSDLKKGDLERAIHQNTNKEHIKEHFLRFENANIIGSINLNGFRIDNLTLKKYKQDNSPESEKISLLNKSGDVNSYFVELGWISGSNQTQTPQQNSIWHCDKHKIEPNEQAVCKYDNKNGLVFINYISLDEEYMFDIKTEVENNTNIAHSLNSYAITQKTYNHQDSSSIAIVHEGFSGVFNNELREISYKDIKDKNRISSANSAVDWYGINDKYWLVAVIPEKETKYQWNANFLTQEGAEKYQTDLLSEVLNISPMERGARSYKIFTGAKELDILDKYETKYSIKLFDRTVDFGWFYIITKPLLNILHFFYNLVGNFGLSIMIVTVMVKISMFSLANRSFKSIKKMKQLAPQIEILKTRYAKDQIKLNQEVMSLYSKNKVNPLSGCFPLLIQIPVFFSLYKVLNVSIDMRHAHFFLWISDLSAPDPTNIFNLFGLIPLTPPSFLHIGLWPIFMAVTMYLQQKMQPPPADPAQAQVMAFMPFMFLFLFGNFPAGLLIYWTWNNILSICQQSYINYSNQK